MNKTYELFPSPCGVLVLKGVKHTAVYAHDLGFRPLAGFWFLKVTKKMINALGDHVSVPLRGSGS